MYLCPSLHHHHSYNHKKKFKTWLKNNLPLKHMNFFVYWLLVHIEQENNHIVSQVDEDYTGISELQLNKFWNIYLSKLISHNIHPAKKRKKLPPSQVLRIFLNLYPAEFPKLSCPHSIFGVIHIINLGNLR